MLILRDGHHYTSRAALGRVESIRLVAAPGNEPHVTPDGLAHLVLDMGGATIAPSVGGASPTVVHHPPRLVMQGAHGHDLMRLDGYAVGRVEFAPADLPDLAPLVEYDHLPESRKDYTVYPRGMKLA